jgi:hypothetical protein
MDFRPIWFCNLLPSLIVGDIDGLIMLAVGAPPIYGLGPTAAALAWSSPC